MTRILRAANRLLLALFIAAALPASADAEQGGSQLFPAWLEATMNGQETAEPILFLKGADDAIYASAETLSAWRVRLPSGEPVRFEGDLYYRLDGPGGYRVVISKPDQSVMIETSAGSFALQRTSLAQEEPMPMTPATSGAFLDYDIMLDHVRGESALNGFGRAGIFTPHGVGETSFIVSAGSSGASLTRLETHWTIDRPSNGTTLRLGDSIASSGAAGAPYRFAGLQVFRNFAMQPGFISMPLPASVGSASVPSVVDIYVNNALQGSQQVAPGPFEITNIPVQTGGGTVSLVVRDLLGREVVQEQSYYASDLLLRRGLHEFSWELGFVRQDFGRKNHRYGALMAATTHRYGIGERLSGEFHAQASGRQQMVSGGVNTVLFDLAQAGGSLAVSKSDEGIGYRVAGSIESRGRRISAGLRGEYIARNFTFIGATDRRPARYTAQAFADLPLSRGAVGVSLLHRSLRDRPSETIAGLSGTFQLTAGASLGLNARYVVSGRQDLMAGLHLGLALGGRRSASAAIDFAPRGVSTYASLQSDPPAGTGGGYRASASLGRIDRFEAGYVHNLSMATVNAQVGYSNKAAGIRLSAAGSIGYIAGDLFAARSLGESFAAIKVDGFPGLRVYADERLVGLTRSDGSLVVPGLRPFERNRIRIEEADLPIDAHVGLSEVSIRPFARSGTVLNFSVVRERGAILKVRLENGLAMPAGTPVTASDGETHITVSGGEIYVPRLVGQQRFRAVVEAKPCSFAVVMPQDDDPQPLIDGLICREEHRFAAN